MSTAMHIGTDKLPFVELGGGIDTSEVRTT
jgi:hypothetical protein